MSAARPAYAHALDRVAKTLTSDRSPCRRVLVPVSEHEDRVTFLRGLHERLGEAAVAIDLLDAHEVDAPIGAILEAASNFDDAGAREALARDWPSMSDAVRALGDALASSGRALVIHVPPSWWSVDLDTESEPESSALRLRLRQRRDALLKGLATLPTRTAWITHRSLDPAEIGWAPGRDGIVKVPRSSGDAPPRFDSVVWLSRWLEAMGEAIPSALFEQKRTVQVNTLVRRLRPYLDADRPRWRALQQWARLRRPCPRDALLSLVDWPSAWRGVIEADEQTDPVQLDPWVRRRLLEYQPPTEPAETKPTEIEAFHARAAQYYKGLDGQRAFADTRGEQGIWWIEKVHHLAHGGQCTLSEWSAQALICREQYWSRARHLSVVDRRYAEAAAVYQRCVDHFDDDDYGWHYLGYNLQYAGARDAEVERAYRAAVERSETNPWWNGRLVSFLIGRGRLRDAREAWARAGEHLDGNERWVAENAHRWVCRTWLTLDGVEDARAVLDEVADDVIDRSPVLGAVRHDLLDAEEYRRLGEHAVYPVGTPHEKRWRAPQTASADEPVQRWFPGQILECAPEGDVTVVYGVPTDPHDRRRAVVTRFTSAQWQGLWTSDRPYAPGDFIELLQLGDERHAARFVGRDPAEPSRDESLVHRMLNAGRDGA